MHPRAVLAPRRRRRAVVLALAAVLVAVACQPIQINGDNRPLTLAGVSNGYLTARHLTSLGGSCQVYREAAPSYDAMVAAARRAGVQLGPSDCYRDFAGQVAARDFWCGQGACHMAAVPGTSNHGWGKAIDFLDQNGTLGFDSIGYRWMKDNAGRYGWNHARGFEPDGSSPEAWHWEWVGDGGTQYPGRYFGEGNVSPLAPGSPSGSFDAASPTQSASPSTVRVTGWAIDPETQASIDVHVHLDGVLVASATADRIRGDVAAAFPAWQANPHGFDLTMAVDDGERTICVHAVNAAGRGDNTLLGCKTV